MSIDTLKLFGAAGLPQLQPNSSSGRPRELQATDQRQLLAGEDERLPQPNDVADVEQAVSKVNHFIQTLNRDLQFTVDEHSGRTVIKVLDSETKEVIRQIPSEEMLRIATHLTADGSVLLKARA